MNSAREISYQYFVKCDNIFELQSMLELGEVGIPYVATWAFQNLKHRKIFPVYVCVSSHEEFGMILNDIYETRPSNKLAKIIAYDKYCLKVKKH